MQTLSDLQDLGQVMNQSPKPEAPQQQPGSPNLETLYRLQIECCKPTTISCQPLDREKSSSHLCPTSLIQNNSSSLLRIIGLSLLKLPRWNETVPCLGNAVALLKQFESNPAVCHLIESFPPDASGDFAGLGDLQGKDTESGAWVLVLRKPHPPNPKR